MKLALYHSEILDFSRILYSYLDIYVYGSNQLVIMIIIGIYSKGSHSSGQVKNMYKNGGKKYPTLYFIDNEGKLRTKRVPGYLVPWYKLQQRRKRKLICSTCSRSFIAYVKSDKEDVDCPYCKN